MQSKIIIIDSIKRFYIICVLVWIVWLSFSSQQLFYAFLNYSLELKLPENVCAQKKKKKNYFVQLKIFQFGWRILFNRKFALIRNWRGLCKLLWPCIKRHTYFCFCLEYCILLTIHKLVIVWFLLQRNWDFIHIITKTRLYSVDPLKPHFYTLKLGFTEVYINFLISAQNIECGYSLEPPRRGGSNEYPQSMFWAEIWNYQNFSSGSFFHFLVEKKNQYIWLGMFS